MKKIYSLIIAAIFFLCLPLKNFCQISLTGGTYQQDFNTLATSGTSSTLPSGWLFLETGTNANTLFTAGTGSSNTGDTYSYGNAGSSDRALGGLLSGSLTPLFGAWFIRPGDDER